MKFSTLRHRIVFLKPAPAGKNGMGETLPLWAPFSPARTVDAETDAVYLHDEKGFPVFKTADGKEIPYTEIERNYAVWANVSPTTGREYEEAQKLREETTYKITTRYFQGITSEMKIMFGDEIFDIISVLNVNGLNKQLQIVAKEKDRYGKEC